MAVLIGAAHADVRIAAESAKSIIVRLQAQRLLEKLDDALSETLAKGRGKASVGPSLNAGVASAAASADGAERD